MAKILTIDEVFTCDGVVTNAAILKMREPVARQGTLERLAMLIASHEALRKRGDRVTRLLKNAWLHVPPGILFDDIREELEGEHGEDTDG